VCNQSPRLPEPPIGKELKIKDPMSERLTYSELSPTGLAPIDFSTYRIDNEIRRGLARSGGTGLYGHACKLDWQKIVKPEIEVTICLIQPARRPQTALSLEATVLAKAALLDLLELRAYQEKQNNQSDPSITLAARRR
jgi:hypothetical protein